MSGAGVRFETASGRILGLYQTALKDDLMLNYDPASEGMIVIPFDHHIFSQQDRWRIVAGALLGKAQVTIMADRQQFRADGIAEARFIFAGLEGEAICRVDGLGMYPVTLADPVLVVTSDVPRAFRLRVEDPRHWSEWITVEAV